VDKNETAHFPRRSPAAIRHAKKIDLPRVEVRPAGPGLTEVATGKPAPSGFGRNGGGERVRGRWQASWSRGSLKTDDTLDVRNAAAAFPAAKPLLRRAASSEQHEPASGVGFPIPTRPGASERVARRREVASCRGRRRRSRKARAPKNARQAGLVALPAPLRTPGIHPWGGLALRGTGPETRGRALADELVPLSQERVLQRRGYLSRTATSRRMQTLSSTRCIDSDRRVPTAVRRQGRSGAIHRPNTKHPWSSAEISMRGVRTTGTAQSFTAGLAPPH